MDVGAIERLGERMRESRAQEASVAREREYREAGRQAQVERGTDRDRDRQAGFGIE